MSTKGRMNITEWSRNCSSEAMDAVLALYTGSMAFALPWRRDGSGALMGITRLGLPADSAHPGDFAGAGEDRGLGPPVA